MVDLASVLKPVDFSDIMKPIELLGVSARRATEGREIDNLASKRAADIRLAERLSPPSASHPFGTDDLGRDLFARVIVATPLSLAIGTLAACGFAALLVTILRGSLVQALLLGIIKRALAMG